MKPRAIIIYGVLYTLAVAISDYLQGGTPLDVLKTISISGLLVYIFHSLASNKQVGHYLFEAILILFSLTVIHNAIKTKEYINLLYLLIPIGIYILVAIGNVFYIAYHLHKEDETKDFFNP